VPTETIIAGGEVQDRVAPDSFDAIYGGIDTSPQADRAAEAHSASPTPIFNQSEAARLHKAGIKLVPLHRLRKRPVGNSWNKPEHFVRKIELGVSGYGIPLAANGLCSIDPDQMDMATIAFRAIGFDLDKIMDAGVRTTSTRPGSGGRSAFKAMDSLTWFSFSVRMAGQKESTTVFELRAGSPNLQDCCPGVAYQTVKLVNGVEVVSDAIYRQEYANNGETTFDKAPELPVGFDEFWEKMSIDPTFRRDAEQKMTAALVSAGHPVEVVPNLRFSGTKLAIEIDGRLRAKFNAAVTVESILTRHDYLAPKRRDGRWASPGSTGAPSIRLIPRHESLWQSDHQSDPLNGTFDAAQASVVLDHGYNVAAFEQWVRERLQGLKGESAKGDFAEELGQAAGEYADIPPDPAPVEESTKQGVAAMFSRINTAPLTLGELKSAKLTPRIILENLLYADVRVRVAAGGVGKTTLALYEATRLALGLELWGRTPDSPKKTMIFSREDQRAVLAARLREIMWAMMLEPQQQEAVLDNIRIIDLSGEPFRLSVIADDVVMPNFSALDWIINISKEWRPDWIIFDPLVSFGVGESRVNDAEQGIVEAFRVLRNDLDACIEGIHHTGKSNAREKTADQYSSRGGTALPDGSRMVAVLNPATPEEWLKETSTPLGDGEDGIVMALPKLSYCAKQEAILIRRKGYGFSMAARVSLSPEDLRRADANLLLNFIAKEYSEGHRYSNKDLEAMKVAIGLSRDKIRAAATHLKMTGRVKYNEVPGQEGSHYEPVFIGVDDFDSDSENPRGSATPLNL